MKAHRKNVKFSIAVWPGVLTFIVLACPSLLCFAHKPAVNGRIEAYHRGVGVLGNTSFQSLILGLYLDVTYAGVGNQGVIGQIAYLRVMSPATLLHGSKNVSVEAQLSNDASDPSLGDVLAL